MPRNQTIGFCPLPVVFTVDALESQDAFKNLLGSGALSFDLKAWLKVFRIQCILTQEISFCADFFNVEIGLF